MSEEHIPAAKRDAVGRFFKQLRENLGEDPETGNPYSQTWVARQAGVSQSLVSTLEQGISEGTSFIKVLRLLKFYGVTPDEVAAMLELLPTQPIVEGEELDILVELRKKLRSIKDPERRRDYLRVTRILLEGYLKK